jgi:hypothetical protein
LLESTSGGQAQHRRLRRRTSVEADHGST